MVHVRSRSPELVGGRQEFLLHQQPLQMLPACHLGQGRGGRRGRARGRVGGGEGKGAGRGKNAKKQQKVRAKPGGGVENGRQKVEGT